jgi:hypothetical protein
MKKEPDQGGARPWPLYLSAPAAVAFWLLAFSPFWLVQFIAGDMPDVIAFALVLMKGMTLGVWGGAWVLSYELRHHGLRSLSSKRSLALAGAAMGACAVLTELAAVPFRPDPMGYVSLLYHYLPPLVPLAAAIGSLYGLLLSMIVVMVQRFARKTIRRALSA